MEWNEETESKINARFDALETENTSLKTKVEGQESLVQKFKTEIGEARSEFKTAMEKSTDTEESEKFQKALDRLDKIEETFNDESGKPPKSQGSPEEKKDIREAMTDDQKEAADTAFKQLAPADRIAISNDPERLDDFLNTAMEAVPSVPESLFDTPKDKKNEERSGEFRKLFSLAEKESSFVPGAKPAGAKGYKGAKPMGHEVKVNDERRLPGGSIPRPAGMDTTAQ